jgi:circadian clock protein KaiB
MKKNVLKLYITGRTTRSQEAVRNLRALYNRLLYAQFDMVVIDVLENPEQAEEEKILATPTLVRITPDGSSRIIGDLSNTREVLQLLEVDEIGDSTTEEGHEQS